MDIRDEFRLSRFYDQRKLSLLKRSTKFSIRSNLEIESLAIRRYCRERLSVFIMQFNFRANSLCQPGMLKRNWSFPPSPPPCESRKRNCYFLSNPFCGTISLDKNCVWGEERTNTLTESKKGISYEINYPFYIKLEIIRDNSKTSLEYPKFRNFL